MRSMDRWLRAVLALITVFLWTGCANREPGGGEETPPVAFRADTLRIPDQGGRKIRGQVLYMPIYSSTPRGDEKHYDLSAFLAVHNTDLTHPIRITKVDFFNTDGKLVKQYVAGGRRLDPLATGIFVVSQKDRSGTGANFLVEWTADRPVNEPLVESVMQDLSGNLGLAFLSHGRIIRELP